ncbi:MAG: TetR/AcrR family transcriptional regulator [Eubacteriaceae bacterium]|nr:TetR/AcrR family transcriptional regulator [Eubacteriaceae bacterium]
MSKGTVRKKYILEKAALVFMRKGFTSVTMKDIVEECEMSRGGVYRYFSSTKEIFMEIISSENESDYAFLGKHMEKGTNAVKILEMFLQLQKKELLNIEKTIRLAMYEFFIFHRDTMSYVLEQNYTAALSLVSQTLLYGIERKEITGILPNDAEKYANCMIVLLEGLSIFAVSGQISSETIDEQFGLFIKNLVNKKEQHL